MSLLICNLEKNSIPNNAEGRDLSWEDHFIFNANGFKSTWEYYCADMMILFSKSNIVPEYLFRLTDKKLIRFKCYSVTLKNVNYHIVIIN